MVPKKKKAVLFSFLFFFFTLENVDDFFFCLLIPPVPNRSLCVIKIVMSICCSDEWLQSIDQWIIRPLHGYFSFSSFLKFILYLPLSAPPPLPSPTPKPHASVHSPQIILPCCFNCRHTGRSSQQPRCWNTSIMRRVRWLTHTPAITSVFLQLVHVCAAPRLPLAFTLTEGPAPVAPRTLLVWFLTTGELTHPVTCNMGQVTS